MAGAPIVWREASVARIVPETASARTLQLDVPGWMGHVAGQHVDVRLTAEDGYQAERSYSIASAPRDGALELTVERIADGEVSPYLVDDLAPGDAFELRGPVGGHFSWAVERGGPLLLIAGGSGLVPLMSMLRDRAAHASSVDARLLVSARAWEDVLYRDELTGLAGAPGLDVRFTLTRSRVGGDGIHWDGWDRRVDAEMLTAIGPIPASAPQIFVCGPTAFVESVADLLVALGHRPAAIHAERFGPTGG